MFRIVLGISIAAISAEALIGTVKIIQSTQPTISFDNHYLHQLLLPVVFWVVVILQLVAYIWLLYASVAEILYALRRHKRR